MTTYDFWKKISEIESLQNELRFNDLSKLVFACLSLSHANADPERGFSHNKAILEHRESLEENTIVAIRMVKDAILKFENIENFPITRRLLDLCALARKKYFLHLDIEKENEKTFLKDQEKTKAALDALEKKKLNSEIISQLENELGVESVKLSVAMTLIGDGNKALTALTTGKGKSVDKESVMKAQMMVSAGIEKSSIINKKIEDIKNKIKHITKT